MSRLDEPGFFPAMARYIDWIGGLVAGEMGPSQYSESVGEGISRSLPISLQLVAYSQILAIAIAVPGALIGARLRGRSGDVATRAVSLLGLSLPVFITGPLLIQLFGLGDLQLFGFRLGWKLLPVVRYVPVGDGLSPHLQSMLMPSLTLALSTAAIYMVLLRSELIQQLQSDHVLLARTKGITPRRIVRVHALRPASPSAVAAVAAQSGFILGNVIIIERIFTLPGYGDYTLVAIGRRDVLAVAGALFVAAIILAVLNLVADALLLVLDPRITDSSR
jgi:peptide/nickel transport system permease protein